MSSPSVRTGLSCTPRSKARKRSCRTLRRPPKQLRHRRQRPRRGAGARVVAVVLVVDDEVGIATLLEDVLQDEGHRVLTASNGRQALERIATEKPDLILSDFMMPVM